MPEVKAIVAPSTLPTFKLSEQHHLAHGKVRFVGEPIACCVGRTRAEAEDLAEQVEVDFEELPVLVDAAKARIDKQVRIHEEWDDNLYLTLQLDNGFDAESKKADVVVKREIELARQSMNPMEGKGTLAVWDDRANQLVLYSSSQTPHLLRVGVARFIGLPEEKVRVIAPDVGGGFGYKCIVFPEELCVAWLALQLPQAVPLHRGPARAPRRRRELAPAPLQPHRLCEQGRPAPRARCRSHDRRRRVFELAVHHRARAGAGDGQPARSVRLSRVSRARPTASRPTSRASCRIAASRAPACASPWS